LITDTMPSKGGGKKPPVRSQYFNSIREQKLDTLRWTLKHGGMSVRAENDQGQTGVQIAATGGFTDALEILIDNVKKVGEPSDLEEPDDDGKTPLMMAAYNGKFECVVSLVLQGKVPLKTVCEKGKTARDYALSRKHEKIVAFLDDPKKPTVVEEPDEPEEEEEQAKARIFKASQKMGSSAMTNKQEATHKAKVEAAESLQATLASAPVPVWPEVDAVLKETRRELSLKGKAPLDAQNALDPAIFNCVCLYELRLEISGGALTSLPPQLSRLLNLTTLIVSNNALVALPDEISVLTKLRNLEAASNAISCLPEPMANLKSLQVVDLSNNQLSSLTVFSEMNELVSLKVGENQLTELPLCWEQLEHLGVLAAPSNKLTMAPAGLGCLQMLVSLDLSANHIEQIPIELGNLSPKKLQAVRLQGNPLADPRIRRFVEQDEPTMVKDLLNHVKKNGFRGDDGGAKKGGGGGKKGKKGKKAGKQQEQDDDGDEPEGSIAELLAAMNQGSDDDD